MMNKDVNVILSDEADKVYEELNEIVGDEIMIRFLDISINL